MNSVALIPNITSAALLDPRIALHALDQTASAIIFIDDQSNIIFFNDAAGQVLGHRREEVMGKSIRNLFPLEVFNAFQDYIERSKGVFIDTAKIGTSQEFEIPRKDQSLVWINVKLSRIAYSGSVYFTLLIRDVSSRQKLESDLLSKNAQLGKLNAQMEKFLYSTSHDLRSPLTSILGLVNLMRMEALDESSLEYIGKIEASTMKLDRIIRNIMNFSKATYQRRRSEKIDIEFLAHRVMNAHQGDANFKQIHFEVVATQPFPFFSDPERMEIVLNNVIGNAIHFFDPNKVRSFVRINITVTVTEVAVEIIDNGVGIGHQHHDQIFGMFYKATLNSSGAGLGLYIVKESLEHLKGTITMESELGFGSVFRIRVPNDHKGQLMGRKMKLQSKH